MIHIVFQEADVAVLQKSFELDETLRGSVNQIKDDFSVGPIENIYMEDGILGRERWWREVLAGGDYEGFADNGSVDDINTVSNLIQALVTNPEETVWIWAAQNKHDVCGYYWLMSQLKKFQGQVYILYLNNLPFFNEKGHIFYPVNLFEIQPKEFLKAKKLARLISSGEFELDPDEWQKLCEANKSVRILEGGKKLLQYEDDFYDKELFKLINTDWVKTSKLINAYLNKAMHTTGDAYLLWRIKSMIVSGQLDVQGEMKNRKDFEVKAKQDLLTN